MLINKKSAPISPNPRATLVANPRTKKHTKALRHWPVVLLALLAPIGLFLVRFLPLFDYPHWVYQAHVLAHYQDYSSWFERTLAPIPNLGSTIILTVLTPLFGAELGAKVLLALYAFSTVLAFYYLARGVMPQSNVAFLGPLIVYNYFFYTGFLSFTIGLPLLFVTLGILVRTPPLSKSKILVLSLLSLAAYLCHLFIWIPIFMYVLIAVVLDFRRQYRIGYLIPQLLPLLLLGIYVYGRTSTGDLSWTFYTSLGKKLQAVIGPLLPFSRADPFPMPVPVLAANAAFAAIMIVFTVRAAMASPFKRFDNSRRNLLVLAILLAATAMALPITWFGGIGAIDRRLAFLAFVIALPFAGLSTRKRSIRIAAIIIAILAMSLHTINFVSADRHLQTAYQAIQARPAGATVFVASVRQLPLDGECEPRLLNFGNGVFPLQWFPLYDVVERDRLNAWTFTTAGVANRENVPLAMNFGEYKTPAERRQLVNAAGEIANDYDYLFLFGCPDDLQSVAEIWTTTQRQATRGSYFTVVPLKEGKK